MPTVHEAHMVRVEQGRFLALVSRLHIRFVCELEIRGHRIPLLPVIWHCTDHIGMFPLSASYNSLMTVYMHHHRAGCGMHIEQALAGVKPEDRCKCPKGGKK